MFDKLDDTIVAISTPHGKGQRGVVRLSGPASLDIASKMFRPTCDSRLQECQRNVRVSGRAALRANEFVLPAELFIFRAPRSYTREEVVEFHTAGAPAVLALIVNRAIELGARPAEAGEFTARAFFYGAMDLSKVEGVAALIQARSDQQLRAAHEWLDGHLAAEIRSVREEMIELVSLVEADIDFADEPIDFIRPAALAQKIERIVQRLHGVLRQSDSVDRVNHLPRVMLVGAPNSGKSTLMNHLSGMNRAVCSPIAGTTRDLLTAVVKLPSGEMELIDTAGTGAKPKKLEKFSKNFLDREIPHVEFVCQLLDLTQLPLDRQVTPAVRSRPGSVLWVANKSDKVTRSLIAEEQSRFAERFGSTLHIISATTGEGLWSLKKSLDRLLFGQSYDIGNQRLATNTRHRRALTLCIEALRRAQQWCKQNNEMIDCAEWVAFDLRSALNELGAIFGEVTTDELLERIFSRFCIGK